MDIAMIGLGRMGANMAERLLRGGHRVHGYDAVPAAAPQAYEVGEEVRGAFLAHDPRASDAFAATRPGHWHADLYALARRRLADAGVTRVHGGGLCTISDPQRFYSHRRDRRTGRMATLAWFDAP